MTKPSRVTRRSTVLIVNTTGTMNQYFACGRRVCSEHPAGALPYIEKWSKRSRPPCRTPSTGRQAQSIPRRAGLGSLTEARPSTMRMSIRQACVPWRSTVQYVLQAHRRQRGRCIERQVCTARPRRSMTTPATPTTTRQRRSRWLTRTSRRTTSRACSFVIDILSNDASSTQAFAFFQQQLGAVGITVTQRLLIQSTLINNVIFGQYASRAVEPVRWRRPVTQLRVVQLTARSRGLPGGSRSHVIAGERQHCRRRELCAPGGPSSSKKRDASAALAAVPSSPVEVRSWRTVNSQFAKDIPYLWLDVTVNAWAARSNVQNWAYGTAADGNDTRCLSPDGGSARWDQIWLTSG